MILSQRPPGFGVDRWWRAIGEANTMLLDTPRYSFRRSLPVVTFTSVLLLVSGGQSQTISSTLLGTVSDPSGNVIPKAVGAGVNKSTGEQRSFTTDSTGGFTFPSLLPGSYTVKVTATGFRAFEKKN